LVFGGRGFLSWDDCGWWNSCGCDSGGGSGGCNSYGGIVS